MSPTPEVLDAGAILRLMESVEGWFSWQEGALLLDTANQALAECKSRIIVEIGSYCGRSTVVLGKAVRAAPAGGRVYAIDPHLGNVTSGRSVASCGSTLDRFLSNLQRANVRENVEVLVNYSSEVAWDKPIGLLFIDGLHDFQSVSQDYRKFSAFVERGGYIAFHDSDMPGVSRVISQAVRSGAVSVIYSSGNLTVTRKE